MIPRNLAANPVLSHWVSVHADGTVDIRCGKVELGQGVLSALAQIAADELDVAYHRIRMVPLTTDSSPDEALTAGSRSIEDSGAALRQVGAEVRALFLDAAAGIMGVSTDLLSVDDGVINGAITYWDLVDDVDLDVEATGSVAPKPFAQRRVVGSNWPRLDIPDKVYGRPRFIHDVSLPGMLYGRVVRPPSRGANLVSVTAPELDGLVEVVRDGDFLGVIATQEETAVRAAELLRCEWKERDSLPDVDALPEFLMSRRTEDVTISEPSTSDPSETTVSAVYSRPYLAHASMAPSCALARWDGDKLELWCHSQGVYHLRRDICRALGVAIDQVTVHHVEGAGAYGHNGADDAAFDAVLLARAVNGRPVQVVWSRADELGWAPFGAAMAVRVEADLDAAGEVVAWRHDLYSNGHVSRPGLFDVPSLLGNQLRTGVDPPVSMDPPYAGSGGGSERNSVPLYTFPSKHVVKHRLLEMPLRTSSLRALGAYANVFTIESFVDELAVRAGADPVEYRLRHLTDERARAVITAAADAAGWADRGEGWGFAFARYSNHGAYCAVVAEVEAETSVRVRRLTLAVDAGAVVSPDGVRNQVEGGAIQSTSWTVKEQVRFDRSRVTSTDWESYPILRFSEVPAVEVVLVDRPDQPSLGAGETAQGPTAAAIANALHSALGIRVRHLPLTPANIIAAM